MLLFLGVLLALAVLADRAAAAVAARGLASQLQAEAGLSAPPEVEVGGVPFLTQALAGRYDRIDVTARDVPAGEVEGTSVTLRALTATLRGARVPLSDALSGSVTAVPVDRVDAQVLLPYDALARSAAGARVTVGPAGDRLRVRGTVRLLGRDVDASAVSRLRVDGDTLVVTAESFDVGGGLADRLVTGVLRDRFDLRVVLGRLPYGLEVDDVQVRDDGLALTAASVGVVLAGPARGDHPPGLRPEALP